MLTHCFVMNPNAGGKDATKKLTKEILEVFEKLNEPYEIYNTKGDESDAQFIKNRCKDGEEVRFYACGGDGTVNRVANAVFENENASMAVVPCGTGNDYIKSIGGYNNLQELVTKGNEKIVDILKMNDVYSINLVAMGVDAKTNENIIKYKKKPFLKGIAYYLGIVESFFIKRESVVSISIDDKEPFEKTILMMTYGKGKYYGRDFKATPLASVTDGKIDVCIVDNIPVWRMVRLLPLYAKGTHVDSNLSKDVVLYKKAIKAKIESEEDIVISVDGEVMREKSITIEVIPQAIRLFSLDF
ncbi:MAG: diacylglycerol kinase family lipid kinase [Clostridia bacterium]